MATLTRTVAVCGIAFVLSTGSSRVVSGQTQTLTTFYTAPAVSMAPMWIAKEVGFFKKQGLDVKNRLYSLRPYRSHCDPRRRGGPRSYRRICADTGDRGRSQRVGDYR